MKVNINPLPLTREEVRLVRHIAGRKPSAAPHLLEYLLERIETASERQPGGTSPGMVVPLVPAAEPSASPVAPRTIRIPAIGQRVQHRLGESGQVQGFSFYGGPAWAQVTSDAGSGDRSWQHNEITPIGPEPHRWITIELPPEERS